MGLPSPSPVHGGNRYPAGPQKPPSFLCLTLFFLRKQEMHVPFDVLPRWTRGVVPHLVTSPVSSRSFALTVDRYAVT